MRGTSTEKRLVIVGPKRLEGILRRPRPSSGLVIFAHCAGSSRLSTRNNHVGDRLAERGIASLLFDLLTEEEASNRANVFDIPLLSERMIDAVHRARNEPQLSNLPIGLFDASTGAAAALIAAAQLPEDVRAVVSRGGRPDLAGAALDQVKAPTLLVVGGADYGVIELNEQAAEALRCRKRVAIVPGATHLFEEPRTLDQVVDPAAEWFAAHFGEGAA